MLLSHPAIRAISHVKVRRLAKRLPHFLSKILPLGILKTLLVKAFIAPPTIRILAVVKATFHLTISMRGQRATGKIQRTNYHHGSCGASLTSKTSSVFLIFTQGTHRNVENR